MHRVDSLILHQRFHPDSHWIPVVSFQVLFSSPHDVIQSVSDIRVPIIKQSYPLVLTLCSDS